jgi:hypothetical protein
VDKKSFPYLSAEVDHDEELMSSGFKVINPKATFQNIDQTRRICREITGAGTALKFGTINAYIIHVGSHQQEV